MSSASELPRAYREARFERTFHVTGVVSLEVSLRCGRVRVRAGNDNIVTIRGVLRAHPSIFSWIHPDVDVERLAEDPPVGQLGNEISIGDAASVWTMRRVSVFVDVTVPRETRVRAMLDSADLRVDDVRGPIDCESDSGEIEISGISDRVSASSDSGSISIRDVAGPADVQTDSGDIEALKIAGGIDAHSDSGRLRLSQTKAGPVYAQTDSGNISIELAPDAGYTIRVRHDSGDIDIPGLERQRSERREIEGEIRGGGSIVAIETDSGSIEID